MDEDTTKGRKVSGTASGTLEAPSEPAGTASSSSGVNNGALEHLTTGSSHILPKHMETRISPQLEHPPSSARKGTAEHHRKPVKHHLHVPVERHAASEHHQNRDTLYSRLASAIVPPLLYLGLAPTSPSTDEKHDYFSTWKRANENENESEPLHTPSEEEVDMANSISEIRPSNYLLNVLTTAYMNSKISPLSKLKSLLMEGDAKEIVSEFSVDHETPSKKDASFATSDSHAKHNQSDASTRKHTHEPTTPDAKTHAHHCPIRTKSETSPLNLLSKFHLPFYGVYDSESESEDEEEAPKPADETDYDTTLEQFPDASSISQANSIASLKHSRAESDGESINTFHTTTSTRKPEVPHRKIEDVPELEGSDLNSHDVHSGQIPQGLPLPDVQPSELTPFQKSILENLNPDVISDGLLIKVKEAKENYKIDPKGSEAVRLGIAKKLSRVFELADDDIFYGKYNAWLIKDVFLQGHLYLTRDCILFFAFLPKKYSPISEAVDSADPDGFTQYDDSNVIIQSGSLGLKTAKYGETVIPTVIVHRFWAILRPQTLSVYSSSTDLYFPTLVIDLKSCIRVEMEKDKELSSLLYPKHSTSSPTQLSAATSPQLSRRNSHSERSSPPRAGTGRQSTDSFTDDDSEIISVLGSESFDEEAPDATTGYWFKIVTKKKTYKFHTDNLYSARQWCHNLTKLIFQLNNSNVANEVLLKIPIKNVIDFERNTLLSKDPKEEEVEIITGSDDEDDPPYAEITGDNLPLTFCVTYYDNDLKRMSSFASKKAKKASRKLNPENDIPQKLDLPVETNYFAFFDEGENFYQSFHDVVAESQAAHDKKSETSSLKKDRFFDRAKRAVTKHPDSVEQSPQLRSISTLQTSTSHNSIVKQIADLNMHLRSCMPYEGGVSGVQSKTEQETSSALKKIGRTIAHPSKIFKRSPSSTDIHSMNSDTSIMTLLNSSTSPIDRSDSHASSIGSSAPTMPVQGINLPRPFSVQTLKSMKMTFETSRRDIGIAEQRFREVDDLLEGEGKFTPQSATTPLSVTASLAASPLNLRDPSEYEIGEKRSKFQSMRRNIKAFSNVSNMWSANPSHYVKSLADMNYYIQDDALRELSQKHFLEHFSFSDNKHLSASYYAHLQRSLPVYGKLYIGNEDICFRSLLPGVSTKMILPLKDVEDCSGERGSKITYFALRIAVHGHPGIDLEFSSQQSRDDCRAMLLKQLEIYHSGEGWAPESHDWGPNYDLDKFKQRLEGISDSTNPSQNFRSVTSGSSASKESDKRLATIRIGNARIKMFEDKLNSASGIDIPIILEDSPFFKTEIRPSTSLNFVLLTIGSRGDVQPYIALAKELIKEGHNVTIATHKEFEEWILKHGIKFKEIAGDPSELMSLMVTHGSMSVGFLKEASSNFRGWINELLRTSWEACQGCDILIESPSAMGGVHIAEALGVPYMRAFTMPWTRTRSYPHAFIVPDQKKGGSYNYLTHVIFENVFWKGISGQVNKWRVEMLDLPKTNLYRLQQTKIPFLYNISPTIFPASVDFPGWVKVTGYWFLDEGGAEDYDPPAELTEFLNRASHDGKKVVYIGFGSIVVSDARSLTKAIVDAVLDADVRCILNKGWSDRLSQNDPKKGPEIELPSEIYSSGSIPHDWIFPRIDAAVHHGGSGTTGATLRSGLPTIIKPFFGDQFFYASRIEEVGVGLALKKLNSKTLSRAIKTVTTDMKMIEKAKKLSDRIKHEDGVATAVETIYSEFEYARTLIQTKQMQNELYRNQHPDLTSSGAQTPVVYEESEYDEDDERADSDLESEQTEDYEYGMPEGIPDHLLLPNDKVIPTDTNDIKLANGFSTQQAKSASGSANPITVVES